NRSHADRQGSLALRSLQRRFQLRILFENPLAPLVIPLAKHGRLQRTLRSINELTAQVLLEQTDETARRRLRKLVRLGRSGKAARVNRVTESLDRLKWKGEMILFDSQIPGEEFKKT